MSRITRRHFVAAGSAAVLTAPRYLRARGGIEKLNIAMIGAGGRGRANLNGVRSENIVALCDVDLNRAGGAVRDYPTARLITDYRRLFDHHREFDAVVVSTTEHTHAFATMLALRHNKHVYCEKP